MKQNRQRAVALWMAVCLLLTLPVFSGGVFPFAGEAYAAAADADETAALLAPLRCDPGEQLLPVTIDPARGTARADGSKRKAPLREAYALTAQEAQALTGGSAADNRAATLAYLLEAPCIVHEQADGTLRAAYPFAMKLLFARLEAGQLRSSYGAETVVYNRASGKYALQYASQADAAKAYARLTAEWGAERILIDLPAAPLAAQEAENQTLTNLTDAASLSWGADVMHLDRLRDWAEAHPAAGTLKVAVIDTGLRVDETTETIIDGFGIDSSRILTADCGSIASSFYDYTALHDFADNGWQPQTCDWADLSGHGTHVMSILLDATPSQVQFFAIRDASHKPRLYNGAQYATGDIEAITESVRLAGERGAQVVNLSQGINCWDYITGTHRGYRGKGIEALENLTEATFDYYNSEIARIAATYDLCIVAAAGNDGADAEAMQHFPSPASGAIGVSSLTWENGKVTRSGYSSFGAFVQFSAPGAEIAGAGYDWETHTAGYSLLSGTSMAAPHITAALALLRLYYPALDRTQAAALLREYCMDLGAPGRDDEYGEGMPQFSQWVTLECRRNDGTAAAEAIPLPRGFRLEPPAPPQRDGCVFSGWFADAACTRPFDFSAPVTADTAIFAGWGLTEAAALQAPSGATVAYRTKVTLTATATGIPEGFALAVFDGETRLAVGDHTQVRYAAGEMTADRVFTVRVIDAATGAEQMDFSGAPLRAACEVQVRTGLFVRLIAFFRGLLGLLPSAELRP